MPALISEPSLKSLRNQEGSLASDNVKGGMFSYRLGTNPSSRATFITQSSHSYTIALFLYCAVLDVFNSASGKIAPAGVVLAILECAGVHILGLHDPSLSLIPPSILTHHEELHDQDTGDRSDVAATCSDQGGNVRRRVFYPECCR